MQEGKWIHYYPGGLIAAYENTFKAGKLNGKSVQYSRRGQPMSEVNYKDNKKHGDMKAFGRRGQVLLHVIYKEGRLDKDVIRKKKFKYGKADFGHHGPPKRK